MDVKIPENVIKVIKELEKAGFEAFVVGGCVRDLLLNIEPQDWDVTSNAKPDEVLKVFPDGKYENDFGTVLVPEKYLKDKVDEDNAELNNIEITTYRIESKYSDKRHPDKVRFAKMLEEDLSRRDFTVNAMAIKIKNQSGFAGSGKTRESGIIQASPDLAKPENQENPLNPPLKKGEEKGDLDAGEYYQLPATSCQLIDLFGGRKDLENKVIRAVGDAGERFDEDALRMMRAVRFACTLSGNSKSEALNSKQITNKKAQTPNGKTPSVPLYKGGGGWLIEEKTLGAIGKNYENLKFIAKERIRDELNKIMLSSRPAYGVDLLVQTKLMKHIMPELGYTIGVKQNRHHYYGPYNTVYAHMLASLEKCPSEKLEVRLASFLHDVGKPKTKQGEGELATFHAHEYAGAKIAERIMERLKYPRKVIDKTVLLVKNHMFYYNVDEVGESGVRRVVRKVGLENINDLIDVRIADRLGSGVPKAVPYKLRHFKYMVEKVSKDAISVKQLKINGNDLMKELEIKPGPKVGAILDVLLAYVIDNPEINKKKELFKIAKELEKKDLAKLRELAKEKIEEKKEEEEEEIKGKYWVK